MMEYHNKPKVFLSHSKLDRAFIEKLCLDLRKCQIEPWLDSEEIRHGKPWLDIIFESGIPTCDSVLVYLTENSISSKMVKKEMDAGLIQQLKDSRIAFLPYVSNEDIRNNLRADIQALQVPIWNSQNYSNLLPCVVSEIWRSFLERTVSLATQGEENKRLKAELELEKVKDNLQGSIFTSSEEQDFKYIWETFNRPVTLKIIEKTDQEPSSPKVVKIYDGRINLATLVAMLTNVNKNEYTEYQVQLLLIEQVRILLGKDRSDAKHYEVTKFTNIIDELMMFGFVESVYIPPPQHKVDRPYLFGLCSRYDHIYTKKFFRFRYWLAYNKLLPNKLTFVKEDELNG